MTVGMGDWLRISADRLADRSFVRTTEGADLTFGAASVRVDRLADAWAADGVGDGDRIAIWADSSVEWVVAMFAAMVLGATYVPMNPRLRPQEADALLGFAKPAVLVVDADRRALLDELTCVPARVLSFGGQGTDDTFGPFASSGRAVARSGVTEDERIVALAFTSGTTGGPKGVLQSQRMLKHMSYHHAVEYRHDPTDIQLSSSPLWHIAGQAQPLRAALWGSTVVLMRQFDPGVAATWLSERGVTASWLVPTMISSILDVPGAATNDYTALRTIVYGAAPMPPVLLRRAMDVFQCDFIQGFGAGTETGLQTVLRPDDHIQGLEAGSPLLGSIGRPASGVALRIVDEADNDVPDGTVGEIVTRSDSVMSGYLDKPEETAAAMRGGWFRAGDLASRDADGYLYLAGRKDDMIIRGGENIYPAEVESVIATYPGVSQYAVVGKKDSHWGEVVVAFVSCGDAVVTEDELRAHCREHLASYKVPAEFRLVSEFPLNASGKILKRVLRDELNAGDRRA